MSVRLFDYTNYRDFIRTALKEMPRQGYGQMSKLAQHMRVSPALLSQALNGSKDLSEDQAYLTADFLGLNKKECRYFLLLVQRERAGSGQLKALLGEEITELRESNSRIKGRLGDTITEVELEVTQKFYADWLNIAVLTMISIDKFSTFDAIQEHFQFSRKRILQVFNFLESNGFCTQKEGHYSVVKPWLYLEPESSFANSYHQNWRLLAIQQLHELDSDDFFFTLPFSASREDFNKFRSQISDAIEKILQQISPSPSEMVACLNIDLFKF